MTKFKFRLAALATATTFASPALAQDQVLHLDQLGSDGQATVVTCTAPEGVKVYGDNGPTRTEIEVVPMGTNKGGQMALGGMSQTFSGSRRVPGSANLAFQLGTMRPFIQTLINAGATCTAKNGAHIVTGQQHKL